MLQIKPIRLIIPSLVFFVLLLSAPYQANAHSTKYTAYSPKQCSRFNSPWKRTSCRRCVKQGGHHYHPYRKGHRCMANQHYQKRHNQGRYDQNRGRGNERNRRDNDRDRYNRRYDR